MQNYMRFRIHVQSYLVIYISIISTNSTVVLQQSFISHKQILHILYIKQCGLKTKKNSLACDLL